MAENLLALSSLLKKIDIVSVLKTGLPGFLFLLSLLAYLLLKHEQRKPEPNKDILRSINIFLIVNIVLGFLVAVAYALPLITSKVGSYEDRRDQVSTKIRSEISFRIEKMGASAAQLQKLFMQLRQAIDESDEDFLSIYSYFIEEARNFYNMRVDGIARPYMGRLLHEGPSAKIPEVTRFSLNQDLANLGLMELLILYQQTAGIPKLTAIDYASPISRLGLSSIESNSYNLQQLIHTDLNKRPPLSPKDRNALRDNARAILDDAIAVNVILDSIIQKLQGMENGK